MAPRTKPTVYREPIEFMDAMEQSRRNGARVAFVPTMGALHDGHLALVDEGQRHVGPNGLIAVSIFVNPTQFGPNEDFAKYPRQLEADVDRLAERGVSVVFAPEKAAMYPEGEQTRVRVSALTEPMCGRFRPGHFEGVTTIVAKLFNLTGPCVAVFGRKDYQQWMVIRRMIHDLFMPIEIVGLATIREADGLAMSSRNRYLSTEDRVRALVIPRALSEATREWNSRSRDGEKIRAHAEETIRTHVDSIDYVELRDPDSLGDLANSATRALLAIAVRVGGTRLIDNVVMGEDPAPIPG